MIFPRFILVTARNLSRAHSRQKEKQRHEERTEKHNKTADCLIRRKAYIIQLAPSIKGLRRVIRNEQKNIHPP